MLSFTGSSAVGREIAIVAGRRLAKLSLELGGKNPLVVCDDADLDEAVRWALLSAFSNAGQRCAAGSRIIAFDSIYEEFRARLLEATSKLRVGPADEDDFGPVINGRQLEKMLEAIEGAIASGANVITGGHRMNDPAHVNGFYLAPTLLEGAEPDAEISTCELFGPIACLYRAKGFAEALALANHSPYGLTACIHTKDFHRAMEFSLAVQSGVAVVNAGHLRQRTAYAIRWRERLWQRNARAGHRSARYLFQLEGRLSQRRSVQGIVTSSQVQDLAYVPLEEIRRVLVLPVDPFLRARLFAAICRINTLYMIAYAGSGHIGSSFSSLDIVSWLFLEEMEKDATGKYQDVYFSSKGHDAPGLYAALIGLGLLEFPLLHRLRRLGGLPGHPDIHTPFCHTNTGPLGMGISKAKGMLKARRLLGQPRPRFRSHGRRGVAGRTSLGIPRQRCQRRPRSAHRHCGS